METESFNEFWKYRRLDSVCEWKEVTVPHDAMFCEKRSDASPSGTHGAWFQGGDYEYTKTFNIKNFNAQKRYILEFEGVYRLAEIFLNGKEVAYRPYGFTNFYVELQDYIQDGDNEIRVLARNNEQPNCRWYSGGGIIRPIKLHTLPNDCLAINGVKITTINYENREMEVCFLPYNDIKANNEVSFCVLDGEKNIYSGKAILGENYAFKLDSSAKLWSVNEPNLYKLRVKYGDDEREVNFGIRGIAVTRNSGFTLNGERVILQGACIHSDNGLLGAKAYPFADARKIRLLKNAGYNAIRSAHNPCSKAVLDACDKYGILVLDEYTDGWYIHKTKYDYAEYIEKWWKKDITDMVEKDYNHPSVIMYSIGNEVSETAEKKGIALTENMADFIRSLDKTRYVTCGVNILFNYLSSLGLGVYSDEKVKKGEHVGSEFFNKLAGFFGDKTMKIGATLHGCDVKTKGAFSKLDIAGYNYGILRYKKDLKKYPNRIILGTETFCNDCVSFMRLAKRYNGVIGDFVWAGMDYLGEVAIGSWEYHSYAKTFRPLCGWLSAGSGRIDLTGKELAEMAYTRVAFGLDKLRMSVIPVDDYKKPHSPSAWKMSNGIESWVWDGYEGYKTKVEVYCSAYSVGLFLNDKLVGKKRIDKNYRANFKIRFKKGELLAIAYDSENNEIAREVLKSKSGKTSLVMELENSAGKEELAYIRLRYADEEGKTVPLAKGEIEMKVVGGELLALGNACPYNERGYLTNKTETYYGEAQAIIKPTGGELIVLAKSDYGEVKISF